MSRQAFEGFTAVVPEGWSAAREETTYSEATEHAPTRFVSPGGRGALRVNVPALDPDEQPGADPDELDALARDWGMRRGIDEPLACATELRHGVARAAASYRIGEDFVELWLFSDGASMLQATYVCPWEARDEGRAAREALVGSIRLR
jgi:hypothetical protein